LQSLRNPQNKIKKFETKQKAKRAEKQKTKKENRKQKTEYKIEERSYGSSSLSV